MANNLPSRADVVVIGGGIAGCSILYHLANIGITDAVLLERRQLTCGTTWHAAGLVGQLRATRNMTELAKYTTELFQTLEAETGQATGFKQNGSIGLASHPGRLEELKRGASMAKNFGLEVEVITPGEIKERWPLVNVDDIVGGVFLPKDGQTNPVDTAQALAKGARTRGAKVFEHTTVTRILVEGGRAAGVEVEGGEIRARTVVLAGGMWSRELAAGAGANVPLHAAEHFYLVTEAIAGLPGNLPVLRALDERTYFKEDAGKILFGFFEPVAKPWGMDGIPEDFSFDTLPSDIDHIGPVVEGAMARVPRLREVGIQTFFNGPESFTPDDLYLIGETPEVADLFVACGFNSIGIQSAGGVGKVLAEWIRDGHAPMDLADVDIRRMMPFQSASAYLRDRTVEGLGLLYDMHWPFRQFESARGARRSPFHERLLKAGACMGETAGWERPNWFAPPGVEPIYRYSYGRQNWFEHCARECRATRDRVTLFDQASFAKFLVQGRDACRVLNYISANDVDVAPDTIVYTQWLNERGAIEADLTVTRLAEHAFLVVAPAAGQTRDLAWLRRHLPEDAHCTVTDMTSGLTMLGLMGPASRALLAQVSGADLANDAFPFRASREIEIGYALVRASRITYVGELGWELYVPAEFALHVFDRLVEAGREHGLAFAGYHAMNALRMEKAYRHWGHDIGDEDSPLEAGLGFAVAWDKAGGFIGREALLKEREAGTPRKRLVQFALEEPERLLYHEEPIYRDGTIVGSITSGMYGHRLEASLGMGYVHAEEGVTPAFLESGRFEIEVAWERVLARAQLRPFYDPEMERIRG